MLVPGVGVTVAPVPITWPVTSVVPPPTSGKRTVTVAPCSRLPTVVPVQVAWNGATGPSALHGNVSTPTVVGRKICGTLPGAVFAGPMAVTTYVPELVRVQVPEAPPPPLMVQVPPTAPAHETPVWPVEVGGLLPPAAAGPGPDTKPVAVAPAANVTVTVEPCTAGLVVVPVHVVWLPPASAVTTAHCKVWVPVIVVKLATGMLPAGTTGAPGNPV